MQSNRTLLSICATCRDGREAQYDSRGGKRLAQAILARAKAAELPPVTFRAVRCMSQCKRPCIISLTAQDRFTYLFGDLDPKEDAHIDALFELLRRYSEAEEGFVERKDRPEVLRASILGRLPPIASQASIVSPLDEGQS